MDIKWTYHHNLLCCPSLIAINNFFLEESMLPLLNQNSNTGLNKIQNLEHPSFTRYILDN